MYNHRWEDKDLLFIDVSMTLVMVFACIGLYQTIKFIFDTIEMFIDNLFFL